MNKELEMDKIAIKKHNFKEAKEKIKEFSEQSHEKYDLPQVKEKKNFKEFLITCGLDLNHPVKGKELNDLTVQIQTHLSGINDRQIKIIREFEQVYNALEALDKDYIQAILTSIGATEITSASIKEKQIEIHNIVENQQKIFKKLKNLEKKLGEYSHLDDIDSIWENTEKNKNELISLNQEITTTNKIATDNQRTITDLQEYKKQLSAIEHLKDVDNLWDSNQNNSEKIELLDVVITEMAEKNNTVIQALSKKIRYAYLIAGTSLGIALIELIIILLKVI